MIDAEFDNGEVISGKLHANHPTRGFVPYEGKELVVSNFRVLFCKN